MLGIGETGSVIEEPSWIVGAGVSNVVASSRVGVGTVGAFLTSLGSDAFKYRSLSAATEEKCVWLSLISV